MNTRKKILSGFSQMAGDVKITLCSNGSNVIIDKKFCAPSIMKDGVIVVKEVEIKVSRWEKKLLPKN